MTQSTPFSSPFGAAVFERRPEIGRRIPTIAIGTVKRSRLRWMRIGIGGLALVAVLTGGIAHAVQPDEVLKDAALEGRARTISEGLRCLVCQNQSIDDSDAPLAKDLRVIVRERLQAGDSNNQVVDYVVGRYGEFVLLRPVFGWHTLLLWLTPLLALGAGGYGIWRLSRRRLPEPTKALSPSEQTEVDALLQRE